MKISKVLKRCFVLFLITSILITGGGLENLTAEFFGVSPSKVSRSLNNKVSSVMQYLKVKKDVSAASGHASLSQVRILHNGSKYTVYMYFTGDTNAISSCSVEVYNKSHSASKISITASKVNKSIQVSENQSLTYQWAATYNGFDSRLEIAKYGMNAQSSNSDNTQLGLNITWRDSTGSWTNSGYGAYYTMTGNIFDANGGTFTRSQLDDMDPWCGQDETEFVDSTHTKISFAYRNNAYCDLPIPKRDGYIFTGWAATYKNVWLSSGADYGAIDGWSDNSGGGTWVPKDNNGSTFRFITSGWFRWGGDGPVSRFYAIATWRKKTQDLKYAGLSNNSTSPKNVMGDTENHYYNQGSVSRWYDLGTTSNRILELSVNRLFFSKSGTNRQMSFYLYKKYNDYSSDHIVLANQTAKNVSSGVATQNMEILAQTKGYRYLCINDQSDSTHAQYISSMKLYTPVENPTIIPYGESIESMGCTLKGNVGNSKYYKDLGCYRTFNSTAYGTTNNSPNFGPSSKITADCQILPVMGTGTTNQVSYNLNGGSLSAASLAAVPSGTILNRNDISFSGDKSPYEVNTGWTKNLADYKEVKISATYNGYPIKIALGYPDGSKSPWYYLNGESLSGTPHGSETFSDTFTVHGAEKLYIDVFFYGGATISSLKVTPVESNFKINPTDKVEYGQISGLTQPTRSGYTFTGWTHNSTSALKVAKSGDDSYISKMKDWSKGANSSTLLGATSDIIVRHVSQATTFTANWSANSYKITANLNGGSGTTSYNYTYNDKTYSQILSSPSRTGYTFKGWYSDAGCTTALNMNSKPPIGGTTVYAGWTANGYTASFDGATNGGSTNVSALTNKHIGDTINLSQYSASKSGWIFVGWNTNPNATTGLTTYTMGTSNVTFYAIYKKTISATFKSYTTSLQSASASVTIYNKATTGVVKAPTGNVPSGWTWRGWSVNGKNTYNASVAFGNGASVTISGGEVYYGLYQRSIACNFYYLKGSDSTASKIARSGTQYACAAAMNSTSAVNVKVPAKSELGADWSGGWARCGFTAGSTPTKNTTYNYEASFSIYKSVDYYENLVRTLKVSYNANGGSLTSQSTTDAQQLVNAANPSSLSSGQTRLAVAGKVSRTGYTFSKWAMGSTSGTKYDANALYTVTSNITAYAIWSANSYKIKFNGNDNTGGSMSDQSMTYDSAKNLSANGFTRTGYDFSGWSTTRNGKVIYTNKQSVNNLVASNGGSITLYAIWSPRSDIKYVVKHWTQNLSGDKTKLDSSNYTCVDTQTFNNGIADSTMAVSSKLAKSLTGFTYYSATDGASTISSLKILPNGSSVANIYYSRNKYSLTLKAGEGTSITGSTASGQYYYQQPITLKGSSLEGYTWVNWKSNDTKVFGDIANGSSSFAMPSTSITLTATAKINSYTVKYDYQSNGGAAVSKGSAVVQYSSKVDLSVSATPKNGNWKFVGWADAPNKTEVLSTLKMPARDVTLYAVYKRTILTHFVSYKGTNRNDNTITTVLWNKQTSMTIKAPACEAFTGWNALGWSAKNTASLDKVYDAGASLTVGDEADHTYYGVYNRQLVATYQYIQGDSAVKTTTRKNIQRISAKDPSSLEVVNVAKPTAADVNTYTNWTPVGFVQDTSSLKNPIGFDGSVAIKNPTTYYVLYKRVYTLKYDTTPGGTKVADSTSTSYCNTVKTQNNTISLNRTATRTGYNLKGWTIEGVEYTPGKSYELKNNLTAKAIWDPITYYLAFGSGGGDSGESFTMTCRYDSEYTMPNNKFGKTGYLFTKWSDPASEIEYTQGQKFSNLTSKDKQTISIKALWKPITYKIAFDPTKGSGKMDTVTRTYDEPKALPQCEFSRVGYDFAGWSKTVDGDIVFGDCASVKNLSTTQDSTVILYAQWKPKVYVITFNNGYGASATPKKVSVKFEQLLPTTELPTKKGYTFKGYWSGSTQYYDSNGKGLLNYSLPQNIVVDAAWTANKYQVTLDQQDPTETGDQTLEVTFDSNVGNVKLPKKTGYIFKGYFTEKEGKGKQYIDHLGYLCSEWNLDTDTTLYAYWVEASYTIQFDGNNATSGTMNSQTFRCIDKITIPESKFVRTGYLFDGWMYSYSDSNGSLKNKVVKPGEVYNALSTVPGTVIKFTAQWKECEYDIQFLSDTEKLLTTKHLRYTEVYTLPKIADIKTGYSLKKWKQVAEDAKEFSIGTNVSKLTSENNGVIKFKAVLQPIEYSIEFYGDKASGSMPRQKLMYDTATKLNACTLKRTGYTFVGWSTELNGTVKYSDQQEAKNLTDVADKVVELYAQFKPNTYTITFSLPNGNTMPKIDAVYDKDVVLPAANYEKTGYDFAGWSTSEDATKVKYESGVKLRNLTAEANGSVTLYPVWTKGEYFIIYDENGGEGFMDSTSAKFDTNVTLRKNTFVKEGYHFTGWGSLAEPNKVLYSDAATVKNLTPKGSFTLVAQWAPNEYSVRFNNNMDPAKYQEIHVKYDESFTFPKGLYSREGYTFSGWGVGKTVGCFSYSEGQSLKNATSKNDDVVNYYALWEPNVYTIHFQSDKELLALPYDDEKIYGKYFSLPKIRCMETGYDLVAWRNLETDEVYPVGTSVSNLTSVNKGVVTLDAVFDESKCKISWFTDTAQSLDPVTISYFTDYEIPDFNLKKEGYTFKCWRYNGKEYYAGDVLCELTTNSTAKFTAEWTPNNYIIKFNSNGGSGFMDSVDAVYDETLQLPKNEFINKGMMFNGWALSANGKAVYKDGVSVNSLVSGGEITLFATWVEAAYTITFDKNDGSGKNFTMKSRYSETITIPDSPFTKKGNTFAGWGETKDTVKYNAGDHASGLVSGNKLTLYAVWNQNTYDLILHGAAEDGVSDIVKTMKYEEELDLSKHVLTKPGYTFAGWTTEKDGTIPEFAPEDVVKELSVGDAVHLYPVWSNDSYFILFNSNGGSGSLKTITTKYDLDVKLPKCTMSKKHYSFAGWSLSSTGEVQYKDEATVKNLATEGTVTLYAKWIEDSYKINFAGNSVGETVPSSITMKYSEAKQLPKASKLHHQFKGWSKTKGATKVDYAADQYVNSLTTDTEITLYPVFVEDTYDLLYSIGRAVFLVTPKTKVTFSEKVKLPSNSEIRLNGSSLKEWKSSLKNADGTNRIYKPGEEISQLAENDDTVSLTAVWVDSDFMITFVSNTEKNLTKSIGATKGNPVKLSDSLFTNGDAKLLGWAKNPSGPIKYQPTEIVSDFENDGEDVILYAIWEAMEPTSSPTPSDEPTDPSVTKQPTRTLAPGETLKPGQTFIPGTSEIPVEPTKQPTKNPGVTATPSGPNVTTDPTDPSVTNDPNKTPVPSSSTSSPTDPTKDPTGRVDTGDKNDGGNIDTSKDKSDGSMGENSSGNAAGRNTYGASETSTPESPINLPSENVSSSSSDQPTLINGVMYKVVRTDKKSYAVVCGVNSTTKSCKIPNTVTLNGVRYKVTQISSLIGAEKVVSVTIGNNVGVINKKAFIKCKKLKKVVIGKNITTIKKQAFFNLPNLKTVVIKSTKLKKVETRAFFKKSGNITFKLPKKYRKKYIKILKKSKLPKKVSFK